MPGTFFDAWNSTLPDLEGSFEEDWTLNGSVWPSIAIDTLVSDHHIIKGGTMMDANVRIIVRTDVYTASGVKIGDFVSARGVDMSVAEISSDGDASMTLICGPRGTNVWR